MFEDMKFCLCVTHDVSIASSRSWWQRIDRAGFDYIGIADTPMLCREVYLSLSTAAAATEQAKLLLMVTNSVTRDVSVTAGSMNTLRDLHGDRFTYAFGAGDSSVVGIGLRQAKAEQIAEYFEALRDILAGRVTSYQGRKFAAGWKDWEPWRPKLLMAANGPKNLRMAAQCADAVIIGGAMFPEIIRGRIAYVRKCAEEAGRDPDEIEIWHNVPTQPAETLEEGFSNINLLTQAKFFVMHGDKKDDEIRPPEVKEALRQIAPLYSVQRHSQTNHEIWEICQRTGTVDYFVEQYGGMVGPADYTAAVQRLHDAGARNVILIPLGPNKEYGIDRMAEATVAKRNPVPLNG